MTRRISILAVAATLAFPALAHANEADLAEGQPTQSDDEVIIVTATRSQLPITALPLTVDVIDSEALN